jgi:hypothetical protein
MLTETLYSVIGLCSLVPTSHWLLGKCARNNLSQAASGMFLFTESQVYIFSIKVATLRSVKRVSGKIFKICKNSKVQVLNLIFSSTEKQKLFQLSAHVQKVRYGTYLLL